MEIGGIIAYSTLLIGIANGLYFIIYGCFYQKIHFYQVISSDKISTVNLAFLRITIGIYCVVLSLEQYLRIGPNIFKFYTVWNWYLLCLYFLVGGVSSLLFSQKINVNPENDRNQDNQSHRVNQENFNNDSRHNQRFQINRNIIQNRIAYFQCMSYHILLTTLPIIDVVFWTVLVPFLTTLPDPEQVEFYKNILFTFSSYNMHAGNAVFLLIDLYLNQIQFSWYWLGIVAMWSSFYGIFTQIVKATTGKWIYFFLDYSNPKGVGMYVALLLAHYLCYFFVRYLFSIRNYFKELEKSKDGKVVDMKMN